MKFVTRSGKPIHPIGIATAHIDENLQAVNLTLTAEQMTTLEAL